jgi:hypothetical protein
MNCPTCNRVFPKIGWCSRTFYIYKVFYDHDIDYGVKTAIFKLSDDEKWYEPLLTLIGIIKLDMERIEKLLILK